MHAEIVETLNIVHRDLGSGSQIIRDDAAATGMLCAGYIGEIKGLKRALDLIAKVNDEMNGKGKTEKKPHG